MNKKAFIEKTAKMVFLICAVAAIFAVCAITIYMFIKGTPALKEGIENARLRQEELKQALQADLSTLWQAYQNNLSMLKLERENLTAAIENHEIASERYMLGNLSGIEMREAQKSLLDAEERILAAEYDTKICEISLLQLSGRIFEYLK